MARQASSRPPLVPGFRASGIHCGIKPEGPDVALIESEEVASAAAVFTRSTVVGAPVELSRRHVRDGRVRCVVVNSGISNVAMGARGRRDAAQMARHTALALGCGAQEVLVSSTGVIGEPLPMNRVRPGIARAARALAPDGLADAARAILTTDTVPKIATRRVRVARQRVTLAGIAKGSGMIQPDMATMLAFLVTDAGVAPPLLRRLLREAVGTSFNRLTIDGETSTSDTVVLLANGRAAHAPLRHVRSPGLGAFRQALGELCEELARALARDGEGATRLVTVEVEGARSRGEAERAARRIANSLLVKTAVFGGDANWGRILQTLGAGRVTVRLERAEVRLAGVTVFREGASTGPAARRRAAERLARPGTEVEIRVRLGAGRARERVWTCDLSYDYVRINAEYTT